MLYLYIQSFTELGAHEELLKDNKNSDKKK